MTVFPSIFCSHQSVKPFGATMVAVPDFHTTLDVASSASTRHVCACTTIENNNNNMEKMNLMQPSCLCMQSYEK